MLKIMSLVLPSCLVWPLTFSHSWTFSGFGSLSLEIRSPIGQEVSKPLARVHGWPFFLASSWKWQKKKRWVFSLIRVHVALYKKKKNLIVNSLEKNSCSTFDLLFFKLKTFSDQCNNRKMKSLHIQQQAVGCFQCYISLQNNSSSAIRTSSYTSTAIWFHEINYPFLNCISKMWLLTYALSQHVMTYL